MTENHNLKTVLSVKEHTDCKKKFACLFLNKNELCKSELQPDTNLLECKETERRISCNFSQQIESDFICTCHLRKYIARNGELWNDEFLLQIRQEVLKTSSDFLTVKDSTVNFDEKTILMIEIPGVKERIKCRYVGKKRPNYIIALPSRTLILKKLKLGTRVKVRYVHIGQVIGFECSIFASISIPDPILFLSYPPEVEKINLRKDKRLPLLLPAMVKKNKLELDGIIQNFSNNGVQFFSKRVPSSDEISIEKEDEVTMTFQFIGLQGQLNFKGIIKSIHIDNNGVTFGIQFKDFENDMKEKIDKVVNHISKHFE